MLQFSLNDGAGSGLPSDVPRPQNNLQGLKSNEMSKMEKVVNSIKIIYNLWSRLRTNIELKSVLFLITNRKFTNRFKITKVLSNSQVKPQNYDPVLSKFYEYFGIIIPHPPQNREENTVLRGYSHYIPLLAKNVRPKQEAYLKNFKTENRGACNLK